MVLVVVIMLAVSVCVCVCVLQCHVIHRLLTQQFKYALVWVSSFVCVCVCVFVGVLIGFFNDSVTSLPVCPERNLFVVHVNEQASRV